MRKELNVLKNFFSGFEPKMIYTSFMALIGIDVLTEIDLIIKILIGLVVLWYTVERALKLRKERKND